MITSSSVSRFGVCFLLAGLALRAATPLGYMPASPGSGLLFELCPGQLPAGVVLRNPVSGHEHHHHSPADDSPAEPDTCPIGHLLSSTAAPDDPGIAPTPVYGPTDLVARAAMPTRSVTRRAYRSRAPPA